MTSAGPQPTPDYVYDGHLVQIGCAADLSTVKHLLVGEQIIPVETKSGRALMGIWVAEEPKASHGPHVEQYISLYVSRQPVPPIDDRPFARLHALLTDPDVLQLCRVKKDRVESTVERYAALNFWSEYIEHINGLQLVYRTTELTTSEHSVCWHIRSTVPVTVMSRSTSC